MPASFALTAATEKFSATATQGSAVQAKDFDQHRGRGQRAKHRANHVGQVKVAEASPVAFVDFADERHHKRVREPHQDAPGQDRNAQHQGREEQVTGRIIAPAGSSADWPAEKMEGTSRPPIPIRSSAPAYTTRRTARCAASARRSIAHPPTSRAKGRA